MIETCDQCGAEFDLMDSGFLGDLSGDTTCHFTTIITALCQTCYDNVKEKHDEQEKQR